MALREGDGAGPSKIHALQDTKVSETSPQSPPPGLELRGELWVPRGAGGMTGICGQGPGRRDGL